MRAVCWKRKKKREGTKVSPRAEVCPCIKKEKIVLLGYEEKRRRREKRNKKKRKGRAERCLCRKWRGSSSELQISSGSASRLQGNPSSGSFWKMGKRAKME